MPATPAWLAAGESALNRGIQGSSQATSLARRLNGTALQIDVSGIVSIRASVVGARLGLAAADRGSSDRPVDATVSGTPLALLHLSGSAGTHRVDGGPPASVEGDAEIANLYRQLVAAARPDLEEELSRVAGDFAARRLSKFGAAALAWARRTRRTTFENIAEYLQEESRDLPTRPEVEEFLRGVDMLREAADRVEARIGLLERRPKDV